MQDTDVKETGGLAGARFVLWILVFLVGAMGLILYSRQSAPATQNAAGVFGGPFELVARDGSVVTDKTLSGKPYAIFFGFTRCPDVCPTSLARMARLREKLGDDGMKFNIVFVSVDPQHDKSADVGRYVDLFGTPIMGLTGTQAQLDKIQKGFGVYVRKVPLDPAKPKGDFTIDHTAAIFLMSAKGELVTTIDHEEAEPLALEKMKRLIG